MSIELASIIQNTFGITRYQPLNIDLPISDEMKEYFQLMGNETYGYHDFTFYNYNRVKEEFLNYTHFYIIGCYYTNGCNYYIAADKYNPIYFIFNMKDGNDFSIDDLSGGKYYSSLAELFTDITNNDVKNNYIFY